MTCYNSLNKNMTTKCDKWIKDILVISPQQIISLCIIKMPGPDCGWNIPNKKKTIIVRVKYAILPPLGEETTYFQFMITRHRGFFIVGIYLNTGAGALG